MAIIPKIDAKKAFKPNITGSDAPAASKAATSAPIENAHAAPINPKTPPKIPKTNSIVLFFLTN